MWMRRRNKRVVQSDSIELQEGRSLMRSPSQDDSLYTRAHRAIYLGHLPVQQAGGEGSTEHPVALLLEKTTLEAEAQSTMDFIYIDVNPQGLIYYQVDFASKVINSVSFNISRVSYCSGDHVIDPCVFAWIFHQETPSGFQLECHAVRVKTERRARLLAFQLQRAFHALYKDVQAALESSKLFHRAISQNEPTAVTDGEELEMEKKEEEKELDLETLPVSDEQTADVVECEQSLCFCDLDIPGKEMTSLPKPDLVSHPLSMDCL